MGSEPFEPEEADEVLNEIQFDQDGLVQQEGECTNCIIRYTHCIVKCAKFLVRCTYCIVKYTKCIVRHTYCIVQYISCRVRYIYCIVKYT